LSFITRMFDHLVFTVSFVIGVQLPEFIQQYFQLITGKLSEAKYHLEKFQSVADVHFNGDINMLIKHYLNNLDPSIQHTGTIASDVFTRVEMYQNQLILLSQDSYIHKVYYFIKHLDLESAQLTLQHYQLAIPLTVEALLTGALFGIVLLSIRMFISFSVFSLVQKTHKSPEYR